MIIVKQIKYSINSKKGEISDFLIFRTKDLSRDNGRIHPRLEIVPRTERSRSNFSTGPLFLINQRGTGWQRPSRSIDRPLHFHRGEASTEDFRFSARFLFPDGCFHREEEGCDFPPTPLLLRLFKSEWRWIFFFERSWKKMVETEDV